MSPTFTVETHEEKNTARKIAIATPQHCPPIHGPVSGGARPTHASPKGTTPKFRLHVFILTRCLVCKQLRLAFDTPHSIKTRLTFKILLRSLHTCTLSDNIVCKQGSASEIDGNLRSARAGLTCCPGQSISSATKSLPRIALRLGLHACAAAGVLDKIEVRFRRRSSYRVRVC